MKKTFKLVVIALTVLATGCVMTSCEEIANFFDPGTTYTYTGAGSSQSLTGSYASNDWRRINERDTTISPMQIILKSTTSEATLTIPAYNDGKVSLGIITIGGLTQTTNEEGTLTTLGIDMSKTTIDGSIVIGSSTYELANLYFEKATANTSEINLDMTLYFSNSDTDGDDYSKAINFTFKGVNNDAE